MSLMNMIKKATTATEADPPPIRPEDAEHVSACRNAFADIQHHDEELCARWSVLKGDNSIDAHEERCRLAPEIRTCQAAKKKAAADFASAEADAIENAQQVEALAQLTADGEALLLELAARLPSAAEINKLCAASHKIGRAASELLRRTGDRAFRKVPDLYFEFREHVLATIDAIDGAGGERAQRRDYARRLAQHAEDAS